MIKAQIAGIALLVMMVLSAACSWFITSDVYEKKIAVIEKEQAESDRMEAVGSLNLMTGQLAAVNTAAKEAVTLLGVTNGALAKIGKGLTNAKPLPVDCKPDTVRVQSLDAALEAVNAATARHGSGR